MARQREFDTPKVLERAMGVFWLKGYSATSISDIVEATGVKAGSLYSAFGGKEQLFQEVFRYYGNHFDSTIPDEPRPLVAITKWLNRLVEISTQDPQHRGCLIVNASMERTEHTPETLKMIEGRLSDIQEFFRKNLSEAQRIGELADSIDIETASAQLLGRVVAIMVLARFGSSLEIVKAQSDIEDVIGRKRKLGKSRT